MVNLVVTGHRFMTLDNTCLVSGNLEGEPIQHGAHGKACSRPVTFLPSFFKGLLSAALHVSSNQSGSSTLSSTILTFLF